jgi:hypothetical protein
MLLNFKERLHHLAFQWIVPCEIKTDQKILQLQWASLNLGSNDVSLLQIFIDCASCGWPCTEAFKEMTQVCTMLFASVVTFAIVSSNLQTFLHFQQNNQMCRNGILTFQTGIVVVSHGIF